MQELSLKRNTKIAISLVYFCAMTLARRVLRMVGRPPKGRLVVLYYHGVPPDFRVNFERQMDALQKGASVAPADFEGRLPSDKKHVALTFDDAFDSLFDNALPILAARNFHATIFVPVGWIGRCPSWASDEDGLDPDETVMTIEQLKKLASSLVALGAHTINHPVLSKLENKQVREEIAGSYDRLVEICGRKVRTFSFPYGDHDARCVKECKASGFDFAFSISPEEVDTESSNFLRGRTKVDPSDGPIEFFLKFNGGYVWTTQVRSLIQAFRSVMSLKSGRALSNKRLHRARNSERSRYLGL